MEPTPPVLAKKLWNIVRIMILMMRKGISKRKFMVDLHLMMKRGKIAGKAIGNLMFHHDYSNFSCKSQDSHLSFINPREYEFSCSNSPAFSFHVSKNRKHHNHYNNYFSSHHHHHHHHHRNRNHDDLATVTAVKKVLEMLNNEVTDNQTVSSPEILPGFGIGRNSPFVRQLRITDSPFPVKNNDEEDCHVDKEAEEFIEKFYQQLRSQK